MGNRASSSSSNETKFKTSVSSAAPFQEKIPNIAALSIEERNSLTQDEVKPILNPFYRELVVDCFSRAHPDTAARIIQRTCQHRDDVKVFFQNAGSEVRIQFREVLANYLREVLQNVDDADEVRRLSMQYGKAHVSLRTIGFKPDFLCALADSITSECVIMGSSASNQTPTNTFKAWTQLVGVMFSSVRDGYYEELRRTRKQTPDTPRNYKQSTSVESSGSSGANDDSGVGSHDGSNCNILRSHSPSPLCSPMSGFAPRKQSAPVLGRQTVSSMSNIPRGTPKNSAREAHSKAELARKAYGGTRSQTAITQEWNSSSEILEGFSTGFYRTTVTHDLPTPKISLTGRFTKNISFDVDAKRKRLEEMAKMSKKYSNNLQATFRSRRKSSSSSSIFDPNSVIDRFMKDEL